MSDETEPEVLRAPPVQSTRRHPWWGFLVYPLSVLFAFPMVLVTAVLWAVEQQYRVVWKVATIISGIILVLGTLVAVLGFMSLSSTAQSLQGSGATTAPEAGPVTDEGSSADAASAQVQDAPPPAIGYPAQTSAPDHANDMLGGYAVVTPGTYNVVADISDDILNVRAEPGIEGELLGSFPEGQGGIVVTERQTYVGETLWVWVQSGAGLSGWVSFRYLEPA